MKVKKLIINADGFGFTFGNNRAIFEAAPKGSISSISVNTNFPAVKELPIFNQQFPHISIGVHLNPIVGKPILNPDKIPSLVGPNGEFWGNKFAYLLKTKKIKLDELFIELKAQVQLILDMKVAITHLDSHQNQHLRPGFFSVFLKVAKSAGINRMRTHRHFICVECEKPRMCAAKYYTMHPKTTTIHLYTRLLMFRAESLGMRMADRLLSVGYNTNVTKGNFKTWKMMIKNLPAGTNEVYCHPGYADETLRKYAQYVDERNKECEILMSPEFRRLLDDNDVNLISFRSI